MKSTLFAILQEATTNITTYTQQQYDLAVGLGAGLGILFALLAGFMLGWYIALRMFKKQIKENPPINEKQIRAMYAQMGRKPTEKQIKQIMNQFKNQS